MKTRYVIILAVCTLLLCSTSFAIVKAKAEIFGYHIGDKSKRSEMEAIEKRFGKTYMRSDLPVYRTSDGKAYLTFDWSDSGMAIIMVATVLPKGREIPRGAKIRKIAASSSQVRASCGVALGDSQSRVKKMIGLPTYSNRRDGETNWQYVDRWGYPPHGKRYPDTVLEITFIKGRVVRLCAQMMEC